MDAMDEWMWVDSPPRGSHAPRPVIPEAVAEREGAEELGGSGAEETSDEEADAVPPAVPAPAPRPRGQPKPKSLCGICLRDGKFVSVNCGPDYGGSFQVFFPHAADIKEFDHAVQDAMSHLRYLKLRYVKNPGYNVGATSFSYMKRYLRKRGWIICKKRPAAGTAGSVGSVSVPLMSRKKQIYVTADGTLTTRWI